MLFPKGKYLISALCQCLFDGVYAILFNGFLQTHMMKFSLLKVSLLLAITFFVW